MKYEIIPSLHFRKDVKTAQKRGLDLKRLTKVIDLLASGATLEAQYKDHMLTGDYGGFRECHIHPDWLLIYKINGQTLSLYLMRTGTHSDLF